MARQSWQMTAIYVMTFSLLNAWGRGTGPDFDIVLELMTPALAYLGLRSLDGWAPYSKASGDKVASAITALLPGKMTDILDRAAELEQMNRDLALQGCVQRS